MRTLSLCIVTGLVALQADPGTAQDDAAGAEFYEKKVRPTLVDRCYSCHSAGAPKLKGGLRLDSLEAALKGGDTGPALVPGRPDKSPLVEAVGYKNVELKMPPKGKLPVEQIADLTEWVKRGAPWPKGGAAGPATAKIKFNLEKCRAEHWPWNPLFAPPIPAVRNAAWPKQPLDRFLLATLESRGLEPAPAADPRTLIRRLTFDLRGLPPTPAAV